MTYAKHYSQTTTPPQAPLPGRNDMVKNPDGAYVFEVSDWERAQRFLILGNVGGTYYAKEAELTIENADCIIKLLGQDGMGVKLIDEIVRISDQGLAPKNDPAIFALALATKFCLPQVAARAYAALPKVCRTGTHLFRFCEYRKALGGGWGAGMRKAVSKWYREREPGNLILQALKYRQRNGMSHRDLLRLAHPKTSSAPHKAIYDAICAPDGGQRLGPSPKGMEPNYRAVGQGWGALRSYPLVNGYLCLKELKESLTVYGAAKVISDTKLPFELIPNELLTQPEIWEALLPNLGITAVIRNLGNMSKSGFLAPLSNGAKAVEARLKNLQDIASGRVHPWQVLLAAATYSKGSGFKGSGSWVVVPQITDALETTFEAAFKNLKPTGKRFILATDVSPSMKATMDGSFLSAAQAAAAMMMITARTESQYYAFAFKDKFADLDLKASDSMGDVMSKAKQASTGWGGTDCAIPITWALRNGIAADAILVYTDNETNCGPAHAATVANTYRKKIGPIKIGLVAFSATSRTAADPKDSNSMSFIGLDASLPAAISAFVSS